MTSAPMSASIMPHVGPAMICASSSTRMPETGPLIERSPCHELRLLLREERGVSDAKVLRVEAVEALVVLGLGDCLAFCETPRELLVPARNERCAFGDALRRGARFVRHFRIGHNASDEALLLRFTGVEDSAFEQD